MGLFQRNIIIKKYNIFITLLLLTSTFAHRDVNIIIPGIIYYSRQALILCNAIIVMEIALCSFADFFHKEMMKKRLEIFCA